MNKLVEVTAQLLEPAERKAILGDLAESGENGFRVFVDIAGLVARRRIALWLVVAGLVAVVGPRLWWMSIELGLDLSIHIRTYWKYGSFYASGLTLSEELFVTLCGAVSLVFWFWASGVSIGVASHRLAVTRCRAYIVTGVSLGLTMLEVWTGGWSQAAVTRWSGGTWDPGVGWPDRLLFFGVLSWPAGYLVARSLGSRSSEAVDNSLGGRPN